MKDTLAYIVSSIVDTPDKVKISEKEEDGTIFFTINVAKDEVGKVIGKEGKIIRALRTVMRIPAMKQNVRVHISLEEGQTE